MPRNAAKLLQDVLSAGCAIEQFIAGQTLRDYSIDLMLRSAVERQFEIIGEALKRLAAIDPKLTACLGPFERMIAFRNVIAHGYDVLDHAIVWQVVHENLPELLRRTRQALDDAKE